MLAKARRLYVSAANLTKRPQPPNSPLTEPAAGIFPVVISGGQFPVNRSPSATSTSIWRRKG